MRLLGVALPLAIALETLLALALAGGSVWLALLVGAALAPTDAALGAGIMVNPVVPARIRRLINVESGLDDGIATPFVSVALAGAATGGLLVKAARRRGWAADGFAGSAVLGLAVVPTRPPWRYTATGSSPRLPEGSRSVRPAAGSASHWCRS